MDPHSVEFLMHPGIFFYTLPLTWLRTLCITHVRGTPVAPLGRPIRGEKLLLRRFMALIAHIFIRNLPQSLVLNVSYFSITVYS